MGMPPIKYLVQLCCILACSLYSCFPGKAQESPLPVAQNGIIDLRNIQLNETSVPLNGSWEIYWKQLLTPADTNAHRTAFTNFPVLWNKTRLNGQQLPAQGYATYRLRILLRQDSERKLAIHMPDTYCSYKLYVNGSLLAVSGNPGTSPETTVPKWLNRTEVLPLSDTLDLLLQVANYSHFKGGPYKHITIGDKEALFNQRNTELGFDFLLTGCLFMGGLFFLGLYLFGKHDKVILFFSLFCITYSYRIIGAKSYALHTVFPDLPWQLTVHLEYLTLFVSVVFFSLYSNYLFPKENNKYAFYSVVGSSSLISLIVILFPPVVFTRLIIPFLLVMFIVISHAFYVYARAFRNKRLGAKYALWSTGVILVVFIIINLEYFAIVHPSGIILFFGYILFFFLQSLILSFRFASTLNTAKKQAELGLVAKNEFLSTMSHEIRTPLNSILGMTHLMLRNKPSEEQKEQLNVLLFSANNLLAIVNDILDYNKIEAGKVNFESIEMDLSAIARNIISGLKSTADDKNISLKLNIDPALDCNVLGDPTRTSQIIGNLVHNAIKFTRRGHVLLELKVTRKTDKTLSLLVRIEDTGIGIAQEKQKLIFEQFTQADASTSRNFGGTGLGLAICKKLLALQGSRLELESEPDKGSVFYFTLNLPVIPKAVLPVEQVADSLPAEDSKPLANIHILLVEDNEVNILIAKTFLSKWGAEVDIAINGQQAVDMLNPEKHKLVLMDMHMPVMDGYEATRIIRSKGIHIPIIALTASLPKEVEENVKYEGMDDIIVKPFSPRELFKIILHYTGVHRY